MSVAMDLDTVATRLNTRPRKTLTFMTPRDKLACMQNLSNGGNNPISSKAQA